MKKIMRIILALLATAALLFYGHDALREKRAAPPPKTVRMIRVWITEKEPAVSAWLRSLAAEYEKETGERVYLRNATEEEASAARRGEGGAILPDAMIAPGDAEAPVALRGYALIIRDDAAAVATPAPTSALFFRPSPSPGPSPAPLLTPDPASCSAVLAPPELMSALPGAIRSVDPAADLTRGKARAALLTADQAVRLPFGYRAYPLPDGAGMLGVCAEIYSPAGEGFRAYLLRPDVQRALARYGLYSPCARLYSGDDPLRFLIENSGAGREK